MIRTTS